MKTGLLSFDGFCSNDAVFAVARLPRKPFWILQGGNLMPVHRSLPFLSPLKKLVTFFHRSREKWKEKCKVAKRQNKSLKLCLAKMKESRDHWKAQALASKEEQKNSPCLCG